MGSERRQPAASKGRRQPPTNGPPPRRRHVPVVLAVLSAVFAGQCLLSMRLKSATFDEPYYISAGYSYLTEARFGLNSEHPPLMKYVVALPLLLAECTPVRDIPKWKTATAQPQGFGHNFLYGNKLDADTMLFAARTPVVMCGVLLVLLVYKWAAEVYGAPAGLVAAALGAMSPNILAHARLATLDLGLTLAVFAACYAWWRLYENPRRVWVLLSGLALAGAAAVKYTSVVLAGVVPVYLLAAILHHRRRAASLAPARPQRRGQHAPAPAARRLVLGTVAALVVFVTVISFSYGAGRFGWTPYVSGLQRATLEREKLTLSDWKSFCWGRYSADGFRWYHFAAFVVKTPVPTTVLLAIAVLWLVRRRPRRWLPELFLLVPVVMFLLAVMPITTNVGLRNILPIYPFLFVLAAGPAVALARHRAGRVAVAMLGIWYGGGAARIYPDYLSYFNELVGGPDRGIYYLDDSNIDWGQDLKQLAGFQKQRGIDRLNLMYFGRADADYHGLRYRKMRLAEIPQPRRGWYAVSAHLLQRPQLRRGSDIRFDWLERFEPDTIIGHSIYVYHFE